MGDDTKMEVEGKGNVEMGNGEFKDFLYFPNLSSNLLSVYQITHLGDGHKVEFLLDSVMVHSLRDDSLVAVSIMKRGFIPSSTLCLSLLHKPC